MAVNERPGVASRLANELFETAIVQGPLFDLGDQAHRHVLEQVAVVERRRRLGQTGQQRGRRQVLHLMHRMTDRPVLASAPVTDLRELLQTAYRVAPRRSGSWLAAVALERGVQRPRAILGTKRRRWLSQACLLRCFGFRNKGYVRVRESAQG